MLSVNMQNVRSYSMLIKYDMDFFFDIIGSFQRIFWDQSMMLSTWLLLPAEMTSGVSLSPNANTQHIPQGGDLPASRPPAKEGTQLRVRGHGRAVARVMADGIRHRLQQQPSQPIPPTQATSNRHCSMGAVLLCIGVSPCWGTATGVSVAAATATGAPAAAATVTGAPTTAIHAATSAPAAFCNTIQSPRPLQSRDT